MKPLVYYTTSGDMLSTWISVELVSIIKHYARNCQLSYNGSKLLKHLLLHVSFMFDIWQSWRYKEKYTTTLKKRYHNDILTNNNYMFLFLSVVIEVCVLVFSRPNKRFVYLSSCNWECVSCFLNVVFCLFLKIICLHFKIFSCGIMAVMLNIPVEGC